MEYQSLLTLLIHSFVYELNEEHCRSLATESSIEHEKIPNKAIEVSVFINFMNPFCLFSSQYEEKVKEYNELQNLH